VKSVGALLAAGAVLTATALVVPAAEARTRPQMARQLQVSQQLRAQLRKTRAQLVQARTEATRLQATLAQTTATLAQTQNELSQTQNGLSQTQTELSQTQSELSTSQTRAAALQAKLNAIPTPLAVAEEQVRREVAWAEYQFRFGGPQYPDAEVVALSAMNYVVGHVSTGSYGYTLHFGGAFPSSDPNDILGMQSGICGHAALTFAAIVKHFGYQVRSVQYYFIAPNQTDDSHIADEVYYDGGWHYYDPTFGVYWTDAGGNVLSITDVRANGGTEHKDLASFTNVVEDPWWGGDDTAFETDLATNVVLDGQPF
jgi:hypothetical protein